MTLQRHKLAFAIAAALLTAVVVAALAASSSQDPAGDPAVPVFRMEADHAVYASVGTVTDGAPVIVTGEVLSRTVEAGTSPGVDALGDPLPAIPHTNYSVKVLTVLKGSVSVGATIVVPVSGGTTPEGEFVLDGAPQLDDGDVAMFFLEPVGGKYYPLAGGAAVAAKASGESFEMPAEATGSGPVAVTEDAVAAAVDSQPSPPAPTAPQSPAVAAPASPSAVPAAPIRKRCRPGFKKKRVKGKVRCVKRHKARRHAKAKHS